MLEGNKYYSVKWDKFDDNFGGGRECVFQYQHGQDRPQLKKGLW